MALDRPFDDRRVPSADIAVITSTVSANMRNLVFMFREKRILYLRHMPDIHETTEKGVSDEKWRKNTADTSDAKRDETSRGGVM